MALERVWCLNTRTQDATVAVFKDETVYGSPNADRNEEAHYILIAKMDENQALVFISGINNTDPLNSIEYTFTQSVDGAYRLIEFNPAFYNNGTTYTKQVSVDDNITVYADIVWHGGTSKFYKAIGTSFSAIQPGVTSGWEDYWEIDPDFTLEVSSDKVGIVIHDDIITFRYEDCFREELADVNDDILCSVCNKPEELFKAMSMQLLLAGMNSYNWQDKQPEADTIIQEATKKFCC